jgi:hypothetical protein
VIDHCSSFSAERLADYAPFSSSQSRLHEQVLAQVRRDGRR